MKHLKEQLLENYIFAERYPTNQENIIGVIHTVSILLIEHQRLPQQHILATKTTICITLFVFLYHLQFLGYYKMQYLVLLIQRL